jgi:hypothetical protein
MDISIFAAVQEPQVSLAKRGDMFLNSAPEMFAREARLFHPLAAGCDCNHRQVTSARIASWLSCNRFCEKSAEADNRGIKAAPLLGIAWPRSSGSFDNDVV